MRVLIIGARGQLGTDLVNIFSDWQVTPYDSEDLDITDQSSVQQQVSFTTPDLVINSAAFTRVDECEREDSRAFAVNAIGAKNIALACKRWDIPLVHISTNYVFDGEKPSDYTENDPPRAVNAYGLTKLAGEQYIQYSWHKHYIIRVAGLFGITPSRMKGTNFVEAMLRLGAKGTPLRIVSDERLTPTYTLDAVAMIRQIVESEQFGIYHVCNKGGCTWYEFAEEIFRQANIAVNLEPVTAKEYGAPARRPLNSCLSVNKIEQMGFGPVPSWQNALSNYLEKRNLIQNQ